MINKSSDLPKSHFPLLHNVLQKPESLNSNCENLRKCMNTLHKWKKDMNWLQLAIGDWCLFSLQTNSGIPCTVWITICKAHDHKEKIETVSIITLPDSHKDIKTHTGFLLTQSLTWVHPMKGSNCSVVKIHHCVTSSFWSSEINTISCFGFHEQQQTILR